MEQNLLQKIASCFPEDIKPSSVNFHTVCSTIGLLSSYRNDYKMVLSAFNKSEEMVRVEALKIGWNENSEDSPSEFIVKNLLEKNELIARLQVENKTLKEQEQPLDGKSDAAINES